MKYRLLKVENWDDVFAENSTYYYLQKKVKNIFNKEKWENVFGKTPCFGSESVLGSISGDLEWAKKMQKHYKCKIVEEKK